MQFESKQVAANSEKGQKVSYCQIGKTGDVFGKLSLEFSTHTDSEI